MRLADILGAIAAVAGCLLAAWRAGLTFAEWRAQKKRRRRERAEG